METKSNHDQDQYVSKRTLSETEKITIHIEELLAELRMCYKALAEKEVTKQIKDLLVAREDNKILFSCHIRQDANHDVKEQPEDIPLVKANNDSDAPAPQQELRIPTPKKQYGKVVEIADFNATTDPQDPYYLPSEGLLIGTDKDGEPVYF